MEIVHLFMLSKKTGKYQKREKLKKRITISLWTGEEEGNRGK